MFGSSFPFAGCVFLVAVLPSVASPSFGGKGESFRGYAVGVDLRREVTNLELGKRASALVSQIGPTATDERMAMGSDKLQLLRDYFAPDASSCDSSSFNCDLFALREKLQLLQQWRSVWNRLLQLLRDYFAPDALGSACQDHAAHRGVFGQI